MKQIGFIYNEIHKRAYSKHISFLCTVTEVWRALFMYDWQICITLNVFMLKLCSPNEQNNNMRFRYRSLNTFLKRYILVLYWLLRCQLFSCGSRRAVSWCSWPAGVWHLYELGRDTLPHLWPETLPLPGQLHVPAGLIHRRDMGRVYEHRVWSCGTLPEGTDTHSLWVHLHTHLFYVYKSQCELKIDHIFFPNTSFWFYCASFVYSKDCSILKIILS